MVTDYFLKFPSKEEYLEVFSKYLFPEDVDSLFPGSVYADVAVVGAVFKPTGNIVQINMDGDIIEDIEKVEIEGFHVNVRWRGELPEELLKYVVIPKNPQQVWADTVKIEVQ